MELRHLRYFVQVAEEQHYGRAAERLRIAQPALSRQIQDLEEEIGFKLFDRLPRGVKISAAGKSFLVDARRILHEVNEAAARAKRVALGQSGTLRVGFVESVSWHGVVPDSFREFREPQHDSELQLKPSSSLEQTEAVPSGRLDAGFVFTIAHIGRELAQLPVASLPLMLAASKGHPLTKLKKLRLRDLSDAAFIWFPRRESPAYYDRLMHECFRGGLKSPHIVQETVNEPTILSLGSCRIGVAFVSGASRWGCHVGFCGAGDAHRRHFRRTRESAVEQAFASDEFEDRGRQSEAASGLHFRDERTGAVAFHRDARFGVDGGEDAVDNAVILGVVFAAETDERFGSQLFQRDRFQPGEGMGSRHRYAQRVSAQQFKLDTCGLPAIGLVDHYREVQRGVL